MRIGSVNSQMNLWALVYDTGHGDEIEFIDLTFFKSAKEATDWFDEIHSSREFINPRAIEVAAGFDIMEGGSQPIILKNASDA